MADNLYPIPYSETSSTTYTGYITQITLPNETKYEVIDEAGRKVLNEMSTTINSISGTLYNLRVSTSYTPQGSIIVTQNEGIPIEFETIGTVTIPIISSNSTIKNINNISLTIPNDNNYINYTPSGTISNTVSINTVAVLTNITGVEAVVGLEIDGTTGTPIATIDENNPHRLKLNFIKPSTANTINSITTENVPSNIGVTSTFNGSSVYFTYDEITPANTEFTISSNGSINLKFEGTPVTITSTPITMS